MLTQPTGYAALVALPDPALLAAMKSAVAGNVAQFRSSSCEEHLSSNAAVIGSVLALSPSFARYTGRIRWELTAAAHCITRYDTILSAPGYVARELLGEMCDHAASCSLLFPDGIRVFHKHDAENTRVTTFTQRQCLAVLSAAFLCAFPEPSENCCRGHDAATGALPSINFDEMHSGREAGVQTEKLLMFLDYFYTMHARTAAVGIAPSRLLSDPARGVTIVRNRVGLDAVVARATSTPLLPFVMHKLRESIDDQHDMIRVDFANMVIGGGSLAYGCVQEEISFSVFPELTVSRLFHAEMTGDEAIALIGAEQFSTLAPGTYGFSMQHCGKPRAEERSRGVVLAIDALDLRGLPRNSQYTPAGIERELLKCVAGLSIPFDTWDVAPAVASRVATGNWGCGAFGGDAELKLLIQWVACSLCGKTMHYFPFDDERLLVIDKFGKVAVSKGITCADMLDFLRDKLQRAGRGGSVWHVLADVFRARLA